MSYSLSIEQFNKTFEVNPNVDSKYKLRHKAGKTFKVFPFIPNNNVDSVTELNGLIGQYLSKVEGIKQVPVTVEKLVDAIKEETSIDPGMDEVFIEVVRNMFFDTEDKLRPINLRMLSHVPCESNSEKNLAEFLVDVLGDTTLLKNYIHSANRKLDEQSNVLEKLVNSKLSSDLEDENKGIKYYRITNVVQELFEADFEYILGSRTRTKDYMITLLEFYYFIYTSQACLQLNRFFDGNRKQCIPLYFSLEWEKTSQNRLCYKEGWTYLQSAIKKIYAHANVLEILNQTDGKKEPIDYIELNRMSAVSAEEDQRIANEIKILTDAYRDAVQDCNEMNEIKREDSIRGKAASEVKYLFDCIKCQFENRRDRPYTSYAKQFEDYSYKYLKNRGRSGMMLNLTEETLIFLTKICIKDQEKMRLNDVFREFEARGVFLDNISKEQVMYYYEKLNLIEKKSDSGDAQYVKRIL